MANSRNLFYQDHCIEKALIISSLSDAGYTNLAEEARRIFDISNSVTECKELRDSLHKLIGEDSCPASAIEPAYHGVIPVSAGPDGSAYLVFPDELMQLVGWQEGDDVLWIDNHDGSYTLKKRTSP